MYLELTEKNKGSKQKGGGSGREKTVGTEPKP